MTKEELLDRLALQLWLTDQDTHQDWPDEMREQMTKQFMAWGAPGADTWQRMIRRHWNTRAEALLPIVADVWDDGAIWAATEVTGDDQKHNWLAEGDNPFRPGYTGTCNAFRWVGQSFATCDACGEPYWAHTHRMGVGDEHGERIPITSEDAQRTKAKWGQGPFVRTT